MRYLPANVGALLLLAILILPVRAETKGPNGSSSSGSRSRSARDFVPVGTLRAEFHLPEDKHAGGAPSSSHGGSKDRTPHDSPPDRCVSRGVGSAGGKPGATANGPVRCVPVSVGSIDRYAPAVDITSRCAGTASSDSSVNSQPGSDGDFKGSHLESWSMTQGEWSQSIVEHATAPVRAIMHAGEFAPTPEELEQKALANEMAARAILMVTNPASKILQGLQGYFTPTPPVGLNPDGVRPIGLTSNAIIGFPPAQITGFVAGQLFPPEVLFKQDKSPDD
jgi:hypothetical protein